MYTVYWCSHCFTFWSFVCWWCHYSKRSDAL